MPINRTSGNMYADCDTWNPIKGCEHGCSYCYLQKLAKRYGYRINPRFAPHEMNTVLKTTKILFVGSTADMFGSWVPDDWIEKVLEHCNMYPEVTYLFQSKNPERFFDWVDKFPLNTILGTTIETNCNFKLSKAPSVHDRCIALSSLDRFRRMVSIEPIMDFELEPFVKMIGFINPEYVSIGANTNSDARFEEPTAMQVRNLIKKLAEFTAVKAKSNLERICPAELIKDYVKKERK